MSVVVPTYNAPHFLLEALQTVFAQSFRDYEVVVVDDGCTDNTVQQLEPYLDRIRLIRQANAGIGGARNRGIAEARGKYVALLDHDDLWKPGKLAAQVEFMRRNPECVACAVPWSMTSSPERAVFDKSRICDERGIVQRPLYQLGRREEFLITSAIMFDREKASGLRYETRPKCIEDTPFQIELFGRGRFGIAGDEVLMVYRTHAQNYSKQAAFYYNGRAMLREFVRQGRFSALSPQDQKDLQVFLGHLGRVTAAAQLRGGYRLNGLKVYLAELPHQVRQGRMRFLLAYPALLVSPRSWVERAMPGATIV